MRLWPANRPRRPNIDATIQAAVRAAIPTATPHAYTRHRRYGGGQNGGHHDRISHRHRDGEPDTNTYAYSGHPLRRQPPIPTPTPTPTPTLAPAATPTHTPIPTPTASSTPARDLASVSSRVRPSVVKVLTETGSGSGVIVEIQPRGAAIVITNFHVVSQGGPGHSACKRLQVPFRHFPRL